MKNISEQEIRQWMSTGMSRQEAVEEITFWIKAESTVQTQKRR